MILLRWQTFNLDYDTKVSFADNLSAMASTTSLSVPVPSTSFCGRCSFTHVQVYKMSDAEILNVVIRHGVLRRASIAISVVITRSFIVKRATKFRGRKKGSQWQINYLLRTYVSWAKLNVCQCNKIVVVVFNLKQLQEQYNMENDGVSLSTMVYIHVNYNNSQLVIAFYTLI